MNAQAIRRQRIRCNIAIAAAMALIVVVPFMPLPASVIVAAWALGIVAAAIGCAHYAKSKGHHPAWGLLAALALIHTLMLLVPVILVALPNRHGSANESDSNHTTAATEPQP